MARFMSSLALVSGLMTIMQATAQIESAQVDIAAGQAYDLEDREGKPYNYIPNYGYEGCVDYYKADDNGIFQYDKGGAGGNETQQREDDFAAVSCCGNSTSDPGLEACGPEFWPFINRDSFYRCQGTNPALTDKDDNNQQTPINIQTVNKFDNVALTFKDIKDVPSSYPNSTSGRTATGFSFSSPTDRLHKWSLKACKGTIKKTIDKSTGTFQVDFPSSCDLSMTIGGKKFKLLQWHIHNAEHTVNGYYHPLEIHMVHQEMTSSGSLVPNSLAVLGVFLTVSVGPNNVLAGLIRDDNAGSPTTLTLPYRLLTSVRRSYWHYLGSLTTPPCQVADNAYVRWFVFKRPVPISESQASYFGSFLNVIGKSYNGQNNRPVQPVLPGTTIYSYGK